MTDRLQAEALLIGFGKVTGLGALAFEDGHCRLVFDDRVVVDVAHDEPGRAMVLTAPLGEVGQDERADLGVDMLDANALWRGTGGATLGLDHASGLAVLAQAVPLPGLEVGAFEERVDDFVETARFWLDRVEAGARVAPTPADPERSFDPMQMRV